MADPALQISQLNKAVEFAHYLAKGAERLIEAANARDLIQMRIDEGDESEEDLESALAGANESVGEFTRGLRSDIYEFRKRAERIEPGPKAASVDAAPEASAPATAVGPQVGPGVNGRAASGDAIVTYWLYCGEELVATKRLPAGLDDGAVRYAALSEAVIFCDRANGETPHTRQTKILKSTVKVFDDRAAQERSRRTIPFEYRALFPDEAPFLELTFRNLRTGQVGAAHDAEVGGLRDVAAAEGLELVLVADTVLGCVVRIEGIDREAIGRAEVAAKAHLAEQKSELVSEFGVSYVRVESAAAVAPSETETETETEMERPRG